MNQASPDRFTGFTDDDLVKELARRKVERVKLERQEREIRSNFLFANLTELQSLISCSGRAQDERLDSFLNDVQNDGYWDSDYDVELRLVKYPPID